MRLTKISSILPFFYPLPIFYLLTFPSSQPYEPKKIDNSISNQCTQFTYGKDFQLFPTVFK